MKLYFNYRYTITCTVLLFATTVKAFYLIIFTTCTVPKYSDHFHPPSKKLCHWCEINSLDPLSSKMKSLPWGLNLINLKDLSPPAYCNSFVSSLEKGRNLSNGSSWSWAISNGDTKLILHKTIICKYIPSFSFSLCNEDIPVQFTLCTQLFDTLEENLLSDLQEEHKELVSVYLGFKSSYVNSLNNCYLKWFDSLRHFDCISFSKNSFNESIRSRIFCNKFSLNFSCTCHLQNVPVDLSRRSNMFHCLSCPILSGGTIERHNSIRNLLNSFIQRFIPFAITQSEYPYVCPVNNRCKKNVDLYLKIPGDSFGGDICYFIDFAVFNLGCISNAVSTPLELEAKFVFHENRKSKEYKNVSLSDDLRFIPFIIDTTGNIGSKALSFLQNIGIILKTIQVVL